MEGAFYFSEEGVAPGQLADLVSQDSATDYETLKQPLKDAIVCARNVQKPLGPEGAAHASGEAADHPAPCRYRHGRQSWQNNAD
jgi:hypothetical protein